MQPTQITVDARHPNGNVYRVYVLPLLCFLVQLLNPPSAWEDAERSACKQLFPVRGFFLRCKRLKLIRNCVLNLAPGSDLKPLLIV